MKYLDIDFSENPEFGDLFEEIHKKMELSDRYDISEFHKPRSWGKTTFLMKLIYHMERLGHTKKDWTIIYISQNIECTKYAKKIYKNMYWIEPLGIWTSVGAFNNFTRGNRFTNVLVLLDDVREKEKEINELFERIKISTAEKIRYVVIRTP